MPKEHLVDMKLPPPPKNPEKVSHKFTPPKYPGGLVIRLEDEQLKKIKGIENLRDADIVDVYATGTVKEFRVSKVQDSSGKTTKRMSMEIQLEKVGVGDDTQRDKDFNED